jgi:transposase
MQRLFRVCAGIDVHKRSIYVCLVKAAGDASFTREVRSFGTTTDELLGLLDWLTQERCQSVAMESTGVYWKPVFNILEGALKVVLVNAQHVKGLPGRKTDVQDCEWLAELHLHGLVKPSFIPTVEIRELRELVRTRTTLRQDRARQVNRIAKVLEDANLKLGSVASDILGVSGRAMLEAIVAGQTNPAELARLAVGRLRSKPTELQQALHGFVKPYHRLLIQTHLQLIDAFDASLAALTTQIEERMRPFAERRERLEEITGVGLEVATVFISEMGNDMTRWPTPAHAASWAGLCPGHHQSAGKHKSGRMRHGNRWIKRAFAQAGWAASRANDTYMQAHFRRLCSRRGAKKAAMAVAHSQFIRCVLLSASPGECYQELGGDYFDRRNQQHLTRRLVGRLESLGYKVTLQPLDSAA